MIKLTYLNPFIINPNREELFELVLSNSEDPCDIKVDWGDGESVHATKGTQLRHIFVSDVHKTFTVTLDGACDTLELRDNEFLHKIEGTLPYMDIRFWPNLLTNCPRLKSIGHEFFQDNSTKTNLDFFCAGNYSLEAIDVRLLKPLKDLESLKHGFAKTGITRFGRIFNHRKLRYLNDCFRECTSLKTFDFRVFKYLPNLVDIDNIFSGDTDLVEVGLLPFRENKLLRSAKYAFARCRRLHIDEDFFTQFPKNCDTTMVLYGVEMAQA